LNGCRDYVAGGHPAHCVTRTALPGKPVAKWILICTSFETTVFCAFILNSFRTQIIRNNSIFCGVMTFQKKKKSQWDMRFSQRREIGSEHIVKYLSIVYAQWTYLYVNHRKYMRQH
jgi:hypothetical protein